MKNLSHQGLKPGQVICVTFCPGQLGVIRYSIELIVLRTLHGSDDRSASHILK